MGCDIHSLLEIKTTDEWDEDADPRWIAVTAGLFDNRYFSADRPVTLWNTKTKSEPLSNRNYRLFAMLADVRNGSGFAGVDTGDRVSPISNPKGVAPDASPEWQQIVERWGVDMHSTSYLTLAELEAYDWDGLVFERGYVTEDQYLAIRGTDSGPTGGYSGGIWGGSLVTMTATEYEALSPAGLASIKEDGKKVYVQHQWAETRRENMGELASVMEIMRNVAPRTWDSVTRDYVEPQLDRVRICFGFDN